MSRSPLRLAFLLIPLALACFAVSPTAQGVVPAPDGGYPGGNTAEGDNALFSLDTSQGFNNTATGFDALFSNTTGGESANQARARPMRRKPSRKGERPIAFLKCRIVIFFVFIFC